MCLIPAIEDKFNDISKSKFFKEFNIKLHYSAMVIPRPDSSNHEKFWILERWQRRQRTGTLRRSHC